MNKKERLDKILVDKKLVFTREKAKRIIMANQVKVNGVKINKAGTKIDTDSVIEIDNISEKYVSRGGLKLEKALHCFEIYPNNLIILDIGASTGGFTDCLLQHGAKKIYCVDVGYGQLDWKLRNDNRVINIEKTNIRYLDKTIFNFKFDMITVDVSFISLKIVLPIVSDLLKSNGKIIALIKPQFEAGREHVKKGGIVDDPEIHFDTIHNLLNNISSDYICKNITFSPIKNSPGNIEYLICCEKNIHGILPLDDNLIKKTITEAHCFFA